MLSVDLVEAVFRRLDRMSREELLGHLTRIEEHLPEGTSLASLEKQPADKLRDLLTTVCLQWGCQPQTPVRHAA